MVENIQCTSRVLIPDPGEGEFTTGDRLHVNYENEKYAAAVISADNENQQLKLGLSDGSERWIDTERVQKYAQESSTTHICPLREQIGQFTHVIKDLFSCDECSEIIALAESGGFSRHASNTRDQVVFQCPKLSEQVALRLQTLVPSELRGKPDKGCSGHVWRFAGINHLWRLTRYQAPSDELTKHFDAVKCDGPACCSAFTLTVYLNDIADGQGGTTQFDSRSSLTGIECDSLKPAVGNALLLDHGVAHSGERLHDGVKYILRSEVFYSSENSVADEFEGVGDLSDYDMVWPVVDNNSVYPRLSFPSL